MPTLESCPVSSIYESSITLVGPSQVIINLYCMQLRIRKRKKSAIPTSHLVREEKEVQKQIRMADVMHSKLQSKSCMIFGEVQFVNSNTSVYSHFFQSSTDSCWLYLDSCYIFITFLKEKVYNQLGIQSTFMFKRP